MHHLTTQHAQAAAAKLLAAVRKRAAAHVATARSRPGNPHNLTLGKLVDDLADAILADLFGTHQHLTRQGIVCRSLAMQAWNHAPGTSLAAA